MASGCKSTAIILAKNLLCQPLVNVAPMVVSYSTVSTCSNVMPAVSAGRLKAFSYSADSDSEVVGWIWNLSHL